VTVAATNLTFSPSVFTNTTHYVDFSVQTPVINAGDPAAGHTLGILLLSTVLPTLSGGYWDVDNVRLAATGSTDGGPTLQAGWNNGKFQFTLLGQPGVYQVLASGALGQPASAWSSIGILTNVTGSATFLDGTTNLAARFYTVRQAL
jgi:hypothetical protein